VRLTPGLQVGPYEVLSALGAGGMAEVYRARDTRLGRAVALKVVNEQLSSDPELVRRFEQEARLAGSLNHPNLVAVYDVGRHQGWPFFVTELLQGQTLRERLARGPVPLHTALDWAAQMARGLAAAHAQGIVHRDVKPGNVFVGQDGHVKLIDFGIAKLAMGGAAAAEPRGLLDATLTSPGSSRATGTVVGTVGYMSPEQIRGEPLDGRSDIFSLGAVLHELLGGGLAFPGSSSVDTSYATLHHDPAPLPAEVPRPVTQVVLRCLEKEPGRRVQSAGDLAFALEIVAGQDAAPEVRSRAPRRRWRLVAAMALVAVVAAVAAGAALTRGRSIAVPVPTVERVTHRWGMITGGRFGPDGRVVFSAAFEGGPEEVFTQPRGSALAQSLGLRNANLAAVSGSGELAVLLKPRSIIIHTSHGTLARVPGVGGTPREVFENVEWADWSSRGELAMVVGEKETSRTLEYPPGKVLFQTRGWISNPRFSHRGDRIAFLHHPVFGDDMGEVMVVDLQGRTKTLTRRLPSSIGLAWAPEDREIWFTAGETVADTIEAVDFEGRSRELYRAPSNIRLADVTPDGSVLLNSEFFSAHLVHVDLTGHQRFLSWNDSTTAVVSISWNGKVLFGGYDWRPPTEERFQQPLAMLSQTDGARPPQVLGEGLPTDLSPDGRWALVQSLDGSALTAVPTGPGQPRRIELGQLRLSPFGARWLPDGQRIILMGTPAALSNPRLFLVNQDAGGPRQLSETPLSGNQTWQPLFTSPDGQTAATVDAEDRPILISLRTGAPRQIAGLEPGAKLRGWASDSQLWLTQDSDRPEGQAKLFRLDFTSGRVLEVRTIGPSELTGAGRLNQVVVSPDGREVAFTFFRRLGYLYILKGLPPHP
jgi:eukaryotic-like serine/threonine-protein kinase